MLRLGCPTRRGYVWGFWSGAEPKGLKRYYGQGHLHFLTFSCYRRLPLLGTARARNTFVAALAKVRERYRFRLIGYVVMPEHVQLLISESAKCTPSLVLKVLKQRVSRDLRKRRLRCRREKCAWLLRKAMRSCRDFGSHGFMTLTCIAPRRFERSSSTCTPIR